MSTSSAAAVLNESSPLLGERGRLVGKKIRDAALHLVPAKNPSFWTYVNAILCIWSVVLVYMILVTAEGVVERRFGEQLYLIWNFATTAVWCLEIGLTVWYHYPQISTWSERIQLAVAVYFLFDSIQLFRKWLNPEKDIDEELLDVLISSFSYLWVLVETARMWVDDTGGRVGTTTSGSEEVSSPSYLQEV